MILRVLLRAFGRLPPRHTGRGKVRAAETVKKGLNRAETVVDTRQYPRITTLGRTSASGSEV